MEIAVCALCAIVLAMLAVLMKMKSNAVALGILSVMLAALVYVNCNLDSIWVYAMNNIF